MDAGLTTWHRAKLNNDTHSSLTDVTGRLKAAVRRWHNHIPWWQRSALGTAKAGNGPADLSAQDYNIQKGKAIVLLFLFQLMTSRQQAKTARKHTHSQRHTHTRMRTHTHTHSTAQHRLLIRPTGHAGPRFLHAGTWQQLAEFLHGSNSTYNIIAHTGCMSVCWQARPTVEGRVRHCAMTLPNVFSVTKGGYPAKLTVQPPAFLFIFVWSIIHIIAAESKHLCLLHKTMKEFNCYLTTKRNHILHRATERNCYKW